MRLPRLRHMTISGQLMLMTLVVMSPLVGALAYAARAGHDDAGAAATRASQQVAALTASSFTAFMVDTRSLMDTLAARPEVAAAQIASCPPILDDVLRLHRYYHDVRVLDSSGAVVCSALRPPAGGYPSYRTTAWFAEVERSGQFTVGEPDAGVGEARLATLVMPLGPDPDRRAYLAVALDMVRFEEPLAGIARVSEGIVSVITADGRIVARSEEAERFVGRQLSPDRVVLLHRPVATATGLDGVKRIFANAPVPGTGLVVSAGLPVSVAYGDSDRLGGTLLLISAALILLALVAAAIVGRRIARPIRALGARVTALSEGEPYEPLPLDGPAEVSATAARLNEMVDAEAQSEADRRLLRRQLTETRELEVTRRIELLERLAEAEDRERQRIAHDVHDDSIQQLAAVGLRLEGLSRRLQDGGVSAEQVAERLADIRDALQQATQSVRDVVFDLAPADLGAGLLGAIEVLGAEIFSESDTVLEVAGQELALDERQEQLVYRIVAEALRNARQHAGASRVRVSLEDDAGSMRVTVVDDGVGVPAAGADLRPGHLGLRVMTERAIALGGTCRINRRPEGGTAVELRFEASGDREGREVVGSGVGVRPE